MAGTPTLFKSPEGMARYLAAYDAVLALWHIPYAALDIQTKFGCTHVIASGPAEAPPLILLHAANTSSTIWFPNIEALSQHYRTYALIFSEMQAKAYRLLRCLPGQIAPSG